MSARMVSSRDDRTNEPKKAETGIEDMSLLGLWNSGRVGVAADLRRHVSCKTPGACDGRRGSQPEGRALGRPGNLVCFLRWFRGGSPSWNGMIDVKDHGWNHYWGHWHWYSLLPLSVM